ncbi:MAG TPA: biopolymer transporter ExbD [bacterium]|nr:MAG: colicin uptake protein TolR [bacterium ADurb.Bin236]HOY61932.1 biopolymer transporter ExbD [bacterium]HPI77350.1 biopolymer transporter ExbD [bacterium]HPN93997.1 biopolymer transporter ExbD [bacterium]
MFQIRYKRSSRIKPSIDFTPLIDCAFTLIIFFAVSTTLISARTGMNLNLPEKSEVEPLQKHVQVSVKGGGGQDVAIFFEDLQVTPDTLGAMVSAKLSSEPESAFVVAAEPEVLYDDVVRVIDIVNSSGGKKLALQLKQKDGD